MPKYAMDEMSDEPQTMAGDMSDKVMDDDGADGDHDHEGEGESMEKKMVIPVPQGVRKFDDASVGDMVKVMVTIRKEDGNYGCITEIDGKKTAYGDEQGDEEEESMPNRKAGMSFLAALGGGKGGADDSGEGAE